MVVALLIELGLYRVKEFTLKDGGLLAGQDLALEHDLADVEPMRAAGDQTEYVKSVYQDFVAQGTKITELYSDLCKNCYKSFADVINKKPP